MEQPHKTRPVFAHQSYKIGGVIAQAQKQIMEGFGCCKVLGKFNPFTSRLLAQASKLFACDFGIGGARHRNFMGMRADTGKKRLICFVFTHQLRAPRPLCR